MDEQGHVEGEQSEVIGAEGSGANGTSSMAWSRRERSQKSMWP